MATSTEIIVFAFAATNSVRVLAYVPQIICLVRDQSGAAAISCSTWALFLISHISTAVYAAFVLREAAMSLVFGANALCSGAIVVLTILRRRQKSPCLVPE